MKKKILFLTFTRADYGKQKKIFQIIKKSKLFKFKILISGMHLSKKHGNTYLEVIKDFPKDCFIADNLAQINKSMDITLTKTIKILAKFSDSFYPDLVLIHGDRVEALASSIFSSMRNILTAHIEGGEISGTIDESIRHSVSKLSHFHFVSNNSSKLRLMRMGESKDAIKKIGSPEVDLFFSKNIPSLENAKKRYDINFFDFGISIIHPETNIVKEKFKNLISDYFRALFLSKKNFIIIYPNNDYNYDVIINEINKYKNYSRFKILPSIRFEYYISFLSSSKIIIGNSSSGIREASVFGIQSINVGERQHMRSNSKNIQNINFNTNKILSFILNLYGKKHSKTKNFGLGNSAELFLKTLKSKKFWNTNIQKHFYD